MNEKLLIYTIKPLGKNIVVFFSKKDFIQELNRKENKHISDWLKKNLKEIEYDKDKSGQVIYDAKKKLPYILIVKERKTIKDWRFYDTLIHELVHLIDLLAEYYGFKNELEFRAYLLDSLFQDLRKLK